MVRGLVVLLPLPMMMTPLMLFPIRFRNGRLLLRRLAILSCLPPRALASVLLLFPFRCGIARYHNDCLLLTLLMFLGGTALPLSAVRSGARGTFVRSARLVRPILLVVLPLLSLSMMLRVVVVVAKVPPRAVLSWLPRGGQGSGAGPRHNFGGRTAAAAGRRRRGTADVIEYD